MRRAAHRGLDRAKAHSHSLGNLVVTRRKQAATEVTASPPAVQPPGPAKRVPAYCHPVLNLGHIVTLQIHGKSPPQRSIHYYPRSVTGGLNIDLGRA